MWKNQERTLSSVNNQLIQSLVITSDPQYPWTDCTDKSRFSCNSGVSPCSNANYSEDETTKQNRSKALIQEQYNNINSYTDSVTNASVFINGDMTAYGHGWQWDQIKSLLRILKKKYYFALGNHDIENNIGDCFMEQCFRNSMDDLRRHINSHGLPSSQYDFMYTSRGWGYYYGSFGYAVDLGNICCLQLNNYPTQFADVDTYATGNNFKIYPNINWVENQLARAKNMGQIILVHLHQHDKLTQEYKNLFEKYGVAAIFAGHYHTSLGHRTTYNNIPVFLSGSASQRTYLILEQFSSKLDIYKVTCNDWKKRSLVRSIDLEERTFSGVYQIISALNNSSVIDRSPSNCNAAGDCNVHLWTDNNTANQKWRFEYNPTKQAYRIDNQQIPGSVLAWNTENRNVFVTKFNQNYDEHYWVLEPSLNGYIFRNKKNSSLVLDVAGAQTKDGTNIGVHEKHLPSSPFIKAQEFKLRKI